MATRGRKFEEKRSGEHGFEVVIYCLNDQEESIKELMDVMQCYERILFFKMVIVDGLDDLWMLNPWLLW